eukprot:7388206-Prymnesium_polylepis.1
MRRTILAEVIDEVPRTGRVGSPPAHERVARRPTHADVRIRAVEDGSSRCNLIERRRAAIRQPVGAQLRTQVVGDDVDHIVLGRRYDNGREREECHRQWSGAPLDDGGGGGGVDEVTEQPILPVWTWDTGG